MAKLLKRMRRVTFLVDRGFRSRDWARKCHELDWDYTFRIANNTIITFAAYISAHALEARTGQVQ